ncbi:hypothetical protein C5688_13245 [Methylocystis sp. MitZ-2018]|nr:hypothetical protein C5688_13245 [Methylocystis sp. MitZ-2018]
MIRRYLDGVHWLFIEQARQAAVGGVIGYCVDKGMPLVSVLVVRQSNRCLDPSAKKEIVRVAKSLGVDVGDSDTFLDRQIEAAKELARRGVS